MRQILVGLDIRTVLPPVLLLRYVEVPVVPGHGSPVIAPASSVRHYDVGAVLQVRNSPPVSVFTLQRSDHHSPPPNIVTTVRLGL